MGSKQPVILVWLTSHHNARRSHSHIRVPECDVDETGDSQFTVRGFKGSARSHALKTSARLHRHGCC